MKEFIEYLKSKIEQLKFEITDIKNHQQIDFSEPQYTDSYLTTEIQRKSNVFNGIAINFLGTKQLRKKYQKLINKEQKVEILNRELLIKRYYGLIQLLLDDVAENIADKSIYNTIMEYSSSIDMNFDQLKKLIKEIKKGITMKSIIKNFDETTADIGSYIYFQEAKALELSKDQESKIDYSVRLEAIKELKKYIKNGKIVQVCENIDEFKLLLVKAHFSREVIIALSSEMNKRIDEYKEKKKRSNLFKVLNELYNEKSIKIILEAEEIIKNEPNNHLYNLICKQYHNIVSLSSYLLLLNPSGREYNTINELIGSSIYELRYMINLSKEEIPNKKPKYQYLLDESGDIQIRNKIAVLDRSYYPILMDELNRLQSGELTPTKKHKISEQITLSIVDEDIKIAIAEQNGINLILSISNGSIEHDVKEYLSIKENYINLRKCLKQYNNHYYEYLGNLYHGIIMHELDISRPQDIKLTRKSKNW